MENDIQPEEFFILQYSKKNEGARLTNIPMEDILWGLRVFQLSRELYKEWKEI